MSVLRAQVSPRKVRLVYAVEHFSVVYENDIM